MDCPAIEIPTNVFMLDSGQSRSSFALPQRVNLLNLTLYRRSLSAERRRQTGQRITNVDIDLRQDRIPLDRGHSADELISPTDILGA